MTDSTLSFSEYQKFHKAEETLHRLLRADVPEHSVPEASEVDDELKKPSNQATNAILAYSKALSIRPSDAIESIENVLN